MVSNRLNGIFAKLKKHLTISFVIAYLLCTTELHQLFKLPNLVQHYIEHKEENEEITLVDFLYMHYMLADDQDGEHHELPFKSHDHCLSMSSFVGNTAPTYSFSFNTQTGLCQPEPIYTEASWASSFLSSIWQPPRMI